MADKKKKGFFAKLKDSLKIKKRGLSGANKELRRKRGRNLKSNTKMASFREDTKANQKLQAESKDARKDYTTYTKAQLAAKKRIAAGKTIADVKAENEKAMRDRARTKNADFKKVKKEKLKVKSNKTEKKTELTKFQKRRKARTGRY